MRDVVSRLERKADNDLWDAQDIAHYLRLTKKSVQNHILSKSGFPNPIILVTGSRRWVASEVKNWVMRRR